MSQDEHGALESIMCMLAKIYFYEETYGDIYTMSQEHKDRLEEIYRKLLKEWRAEE